MKRKSKSETTEPAAPANDQTAAEAPAPVVAPDPCGACRQRDEVIKRLDEQLGLARAKLDGIVLILR